MGLLPKDSSCGSIRAEKIQLNDKVIISSAEFKGAGRSGGPGCPFPCGC